MDTKNNEVVSTTTKKTKAKAVQLQNEIESFDVENAIRTYKYQLDLLGIKYPEDASLDTLVALRKAFNEINNVAKEVNNELKSAEALNTMEDKVRVRIICNNPNKRAYKGEFFGAGNAYGAIRAFVPYNCSTAQDMMVPRGILNAMAHREFLHVRELTDKERRESGVAVQHVTSYSKEFTIIELPMDR